MHFLLVDIKNAIQPVVRASRVHFDVFGLNFHVQHLVSITLVLLWTIGIRKIRFYKSVVDFNVVLQGKTLVVE